MHVSEEEIKAELQIHEEWKDEFEVLMKGVGRCFARSELRKHAKEYLQGLLSDMPRKNGWQLAEHAGDPNPYGKQNLLARSKWSHDDLLQLTQAYITEHLGQQQLSLIVDDTGFLKGGYHSVGVKRQYTGTAGKVANCQIGVFLTYATGCGHALWDRELYLPIDGLLDAFAQGLGTICRLDIDGWFTHAGYQLNS